MTMDEPFDARLDRLLASWAEQQRLDQRQADVILHAIAGRTTEPLPVTWWSDLSAQIAAAVVMATQRPAAVSW
jgi:hypothetical protein